ncbi:MAG TPA: hypothetical protein VG248_17170 [Caulobacteraceae bacterium]|jgi:hypothetical protein|nr:hypothetical protein [Caulobacteraceae bacterium]
MQLRRLIPTVLAACLLAKPALAALSVAALGSTSAAAGSTTLSFTTTASCGSAGVPSLVYVFTYENSGSGLKASGVTAGGTAMNAVNAGWGGASTSRGFYLPFANGLASGSSIVVTYLSNAVAQSAIAACVTGYPLTLSLDANSTTGWNGTGAGPLAIGPTPAPAYTNEIAFGVLEVNSVSSTTVTDPAGFTAVNTNYEHGGNSNGIHLAWAPMSAAETYSPSLSISRSWAGNVDSFGYASGGGGGPTAAQLCTMQMIGVMPGPCAP